MIFNLIEFYKECTSQPNLHSMVTDFDYKQCITLQVGSSWKCLQVVQPCLLKWSPIESVPKYLDVTCKSPWITHPLNLR